MKLLALRFVSCVAFLMMCVSSHAAPQTHKYHLDNGLTVLITEKPSSPTTAIYAWVKTGSANENQYLGTGITHFVEHMLFKGTATRGVGEIPNQVKAIGGKINASTSYDYTVFTLTVPNDSMEQGIEIMADMMKNAIIDPEEVEKEREVIVNEMRMVNDRPERQLSNLVFDTVFQRHPYQHPIIGYPDLFDTITQEHLMDYYKTWYVPNNIILAVAGGSSRDDVEPLVEQWFGDFKQAIFPIRHLPPEGQQITPRYAEKEYPTELTRVSIAYQGISIFHEDVYALDVLAMAMGQGKSAHLYKTILKEQELVSSIDASNWTPYDKGIFYVSTTLKSTTTVDQVVAAIEHEIEQIKKRGLSKEELNKVKRQVLADNVYGVETAPGLAYRTAIEEAFLGDPEFSEKYMEQINRVTNDDVMRVARQYLTDINQSIVVLKPEQEEAMLDDMMQGQADEVTKIELDSGARLLLKKDDSIATINIAVVFEAGARHDTDTLLGVGKLTGKLWRYGTKRYSFEKLNDEVEGLGGGISTEMRGDTLSMHMRFLAQDTDQVLTYLNEMLLHPTFPEKELTHLKNQTRQALKLQKDNIGHQTFQRVKKLLFQDHPYARDSKGTEATLDRITRQDVVDTFHRYISKDNVTIAVYGDIDVDHIQDELIKTIDRLPEQDIRLPQYDQPTMDAFVDDAMTMDKEQAMVVVAFQGPNIYNEDVYPLDIIMSIMGSSLDGRLFKNIREEHGKAYSTHAAFSAAVDTGLIYFYALTDPETVEDVKTLMWEQIDAMKDGFTEKEVSSAKISLISRQAMSLEALWAQANVAAKDEMLGLGHDYYQVYDDKINAVTDERLMETVGQYIDRDRAVMVVTTPPKDK